MIEINKYRKNIAASFSVLSLLVLFTQCNLSEKEKPAATVAAGETIFFDDFASGKLDTAKWNVEITGMHVNDELQAYIDSPAVISFMKNAEDAGATNGALVLEPKFSPGFVTGDGQKFDFISGRLNTKNKFEFAYGTAAARIKLTDGPGLWPAWWMLGNGNWPETGEIDIMEYVGEKDWISAAIHGKGYAGDAGLVNKFYFNDAGNDVTSWHIYAVDWTPESLVFKYDDVPMFRVTKSMTQFFGPWAFDNAKYLILNYAVGGVYPFKTIGVKQPYYGLPAATLDSIKNGKSRMLVDWVRVTKK